MQATEANLANLNGGEEHVRELLAPLYEAPDQSAILSDIDGTLAPIAPLPESARVPPGISARLAELTKLYKLVGCVSGRRALEARRMVGVDTMTYLGNHGYELLAPNASEPEIRAEALRYVDLVRDFVERFSPELRDLGVRVEDKQEILALHWRGALDEEAAEGRMREIAADASTDGLQPHWGRKVLEIRPPLDTDKGTALTSLLKTHGIKRALYAGDDVTDLDAFIGLRSLRDGGDLTYAVCVGVGSEEGPKEIAAEADFAVEGVEGVAIVLGLLADEAREHSA